MFLSLALATLACAKPSTPKPFEFKDGDRIVWIGSTLVEREQRYGYWETALLAANADKRITVRNLGWSGDTVHGEARGRFDFDKPDVCFRQLVSLTLELKPTVIFICYGTNESFEGKEGLPKFEKGLNKLLDAIKPAGARIVLFSPMPFEKAGSPLPQNEILKEYGKAGERIATVRGLPFADLFHHASQRIFSIKTPFPLTENGMHLTGEGYGFLAGQFLASFGMEKNDRLPTEGLERLRQAVIAKNELFFHRWRPQNETYLFGFRKHEQGRNAKEVAEFDPLVAKAEEEIERIRKTLR